MRIRCGIFLWVMIAFLISGCTPYVDIRGYNPEDFDPKKVHVGKDSKDDVKRELGSPTFISVFPDHGVTWYYVSKKTSTVSFHRSETLDQKSMIVQFNEQGIVKDVQMQEGELVLTMNPECTPIKGHETGVLKDVFGNFGRYLNKKKMQ